MKKVLHCGVACLALSAFALGQSAGRADTPDFAADIQVELTPAWVQLFNGQGINDQVLNVDPVRTEVPFRATLNIYGHRSGHAGLLIGTQMTPPNTFVKLGGEVSQLFLQPNSVHLVLFESFDFSSSWAFVIDERQHKGSVDFVGPPVPTAYLGLQWYAQAYVTSQWGTELSTMAGGVVGNCP